MSDYKGIPSAPLGEQGYQGQGGDQYPPPPPAYSQPQAYPPQPAYPPPQAAYPPQPAYPPPQPAAYPPPQAAYPPPQYNNNSNQPLLQNQPAGNTVILTEHVVRSDHFIIISIIVVIWSFFCGLAYLLCSVPALILSIMAKDDEKVGHCEVARSKQRLSIILNIVAVVTSVIINVTFAILIFTHNI